jgi:hypothetical protein
MQSSVIYTNSVPTSQETHYISITRKNHLMMFREISILKITRNIHTVGAKISEFCSVKASGKYSDHFGLKG